MRIHTSAQVTGMVILNAAREAGVTLENWDEKGSKSHDHAWEIKLTGNSRRRPNGGNSGAGDAYAATWDQWGVFLAHIFEADSNAKCYAYADGYAFHDFTGDRFEDGWPEDAHGDHTFRYVGQLVTGVSLHRCTKCTAVQRYQH